MKQIIKRFTATTGTITFFSAIGVLLLMEGNVITVGQAYTYCGLLLAYTVAAQITFKLVNKNAPRCGNTKRADKKIF